MELPCGLTIAVPGTSLQQQHLQTIATAQMEQRGKGRRGSWLAAFIRIPAIDVVGVRSPSNAD